MVSGEFLLTALAVVAVPGTGVIYTVSSGLAGNRRSGAAAALGCTLGILPHLAACILGLSAVMQLGATVFRVLRIAGCLYLLYLAWGLWRSGGTLTLSGGREASGTGKTILRGMAINLLNPKLTLFFFAFLPVFLSPESVSPLREMLVLSLIFMGMTLAVFVLYGLLAGSAGRLLAGSKTLSRRLNRSFALIMAAMALKLSLTED